MKSLLNGEERKETLKIIEQLAQRVTLNVETRHGASLQNNCERVIVSGNRVMKSLLNGEERKETLKII